MTTVPLGELFRARTHTRPSRATNVAHEARQHGDIETNNTTAHRQQGTTETAITSAAESAAKTPISQPQRRWRFHLHTLTSEQRRRWFQTTRPPGRQGQAAAPAGPEAMSGPAISHLDPPTRTWARWHARGQRRPGAGLGVDVRIKGLTRMFRGLRANGARCLAPLCPKRRPLRTQHPAFSVFRQGGLHFGHHTAARRGRAVTERGKWRH